MATRLEDLPVELFLSIFDYLWAHELFYSLANLNSYIDQIISNAQLHITSENQNIIYSPQCVLSLILTTSPISLTDFINIRSLTLIRCDLDNLLQLPPRLSRLCIQNTNLSPTTIKLIFESPSLINVQLNLYHKLIIDFSTLTPNRNICPIEYLTINYISLNDIIELLQYTSKLKFLHISLFGITRRKITNSVSIPRIARLICLSMGISFDVLCSQFLSIYVPHVENLSLFTSYVDRNVFIHSLEDLLIHHLRHVKKLNVSAQFLFHRTLNDNHENIETIATQFRTAFWIKRNCRATFKCSNDGDAYTVRLYLQTNKKTRTRPSRF